VQRRPGNKKLHILYSSPNIIYEDAQIKKGYYVTKRIVYTVMAGAHLENLRVDGRVILQFIIKELNEMVWTGFFWFRERQVAGSCEHD
jgi:hypothetical protein